MLVAALRDLQFRAKRFAITVVGTALVFALTLVLAGLTSAFKVEADDTIDKLPLDGWVIDESSYGPMLSAVVMPADSVEAVRAMPGVEAAGGMALGTHTLELGGLVDVVIVAAEPEGPGMPEPDSGRAPSQPGEVMASSRLGLDIGDTFEAAERTFEVVGLVNGSSLLAGVATLFLILEDAYDVAFGGYEAITSVAYVGAVSDLPEGLVPASRSEAVTDLLRPIESAQSAIRTVSVLLWTVAGLIIGSVVYLSVLERERDFAVFKATGWSTASLLGAVAVQAIVLALLAAAIGAVIGTLLAPVFPLRVEILPSAYLALPALAVVVGLLASAAGLRRITNVDPASAFG